MGMNIKLNYLRKYNYYWTCWISKNVLEYEKMDKSCTDTNYSQVRWEKENILISLHTAADFHVI